MARETIEVDLPLADLSEFQRQMDDIGRTADGFARSLTSGLKAAVVEGRSLESVFRQIALSASSRVISSALAPLEQLAGQAIGQILPFAKGGVVSAPAVFGVSGGLGLMGEAGSEAILPLARGADGRLGVRSPGSGGAAAPSIQVNIATRDVDSFRRSEAQVSAMVARAVGRGRRGL